MRRDKRRFVLDNLEVRRSYLLDLIASTTWSYVIPEYHTSKGDLTLANASADPDSHLFTVRDWYEQVSREIASLDLRLTRKYFPETYKEKLSGYVKHTKK